MYATVVTEQTGNPLIYQWLFLYREVEFSSWHIHDMSNHQPHECLLNCLFRRRRKKTSKLRVTGLCVSTVNSPHKWPVTRKMFPFGNVIMYFNFIHLAINRTLSMAGYEISENSSISCVFILWWCIYWVMPNIGFSIWISNHIHAKLWGVINYWCPNLKGGWP